MFNSYPPHNRRTRTHTHTHTHIVNARIKNIGSVCYLNAYLQVIASCPILPNCLSNMPNHRGSFHCTVLWQLLLVHWSVKTKWRKQWIRQIFSKKSLFHVLISFQNPVQVNVSYVSAICSKYAYSHYDYCLTLTICTSVWQNNRRRSQIWPSTKRITPCWVWGWWCNHFRRQSARA